MSKATPSPQFQSNSSTSANLTANNLASNHFKYIWGTYRDALLGAAKVDVGTWHAMDVSGRPELVTREIPAHFIIWIPPTIEDLQEVYKPNLPWAEDHFQERVSGEPLNPGVQYKNWPWQGKMDEHVDPVFTHTYMERFWPKRAGGATKYVENLGLRYPLGDLNDVVSLLARQPATRQAFLPVWFPEDTGAVHGGRVPCTLGYQFLLRGDRLNCHYFIRSCDFVRHFRDDLYLAARLTQWVLEKVRQSGDEEKPEGWQGVRPGNLTFTCPSLHIMEGDRARLIAERKRSKTE